MTKNKSIHLLLKKKKKTHNLVKMSEKKRIKNPYFYFIVHILQILNL